MFGVSKKVVFLHPQIERHAKGHRFDSVMLHKQKKPHRW